MSGHAVVIAGGGRTGLMLAAESDLPKRLRPCHPDRVAAREHVKVGGDAMSYPR
jgi:hypothetical protein